MKTKNPWVNIVSLGFGITLTLIIATIVFSWTSGLIEGELVKIFGALTNKTPEIVKGEATGRYANYAGLIVALIPTFLIVVLVGYSGIEVIPPAHVACLAILGYRIRIRFWEGPHWRPPFASRFLQFTTEIETLPLAPAGEYVVAPSKDLNNMNARGTIQYAIEDPYLATNVRDVKKSLLEFSLALLRLAIAEGKTEELPLAKKGISDYIRNGKPWIPNIPDIESPLEMEAEKLGARITAVNVTDMDPPKVIVEAKEQSGKEEAQANAQDIEARRFRERVLEFIKGTDMTYERGVNEMSLLMGDKSIKKVLVESVGGGKEGQTTGVAPVIVINDNK